MALAIKNQLCYKPSSVFDNHLSSFAVACKIKRFEERERTSAFLFFPCIRWGLQSTNYLQFAGSLLHYLSTLTKNLAVYFCCTILRVAPTGR